MSLIINNQILFNAFGGGLILGGGGVIVRCIVVVYRW